MGLIKEPKDIDLSTKSEPWTEAELADFRQLMRDMKAKNAKQKQASAAMKSKQKQLAE